MVGVMIIHALPWVLFATFLLALWLRRKQQLDGIAAQPVSDERFHRLWRERLSWDAVLAVMTGMMSVFNLTTTHPGDGFVNGHMGTAIWLLVCAWKSSDVWRQTRLGWPDADETKYARRLLPEGSVFAPGAVFGENGAVRR